MTSNLENGESNQLRDPIFEIEKVQLMFSLQNIVSMVVANNILCMALKTGRIIRIDLDHPEAVDDIDLPRKPSETGQIRHIFLDPTGTHLLITTTAGDSYSLNGSSTKPKALARLKGLMIESVGWCPNHPTRITGEILLGTADGTIQETMIEPSNEYFKREDRYLRQVWKNTTGDAITGIQTFNGSETNTRRVIACSKGRLWFWQGKLSRRGERDVTPAYPKFFEKEEPLMEEFDTNDNECLSVSPMKGNRNPSRVFAWLTGIGVVHGSMIFNDKDKNGVLKQAQLLLYDQLKWLNSDEPIRSMLLTEYHIIMLQGKNTVIAVNRLNSQLAFKEEIKGDNNNNEPILGLCADKHVSTFWAYSEENIYEIKVVGNEEREIWKTFLECGEYEEALKLAKDGYSRDVVLTSYGEKLLKDGDYTKAASMLGQCSKSFETCSLEFMESGEFDALYIYLVAKLKSLNKSHTMQRTILTSWVIEVLMEKMNSLDDQYAAVVVAAGGGDDNGDDERAAIKAKLNEVNKLYLKFISDYKHDLEKNTVYEIISMHSRREELLHYASTVDDGAFVLSYWIRMEEWEKALQVLRAENSTSLTYKYATVMLVNAPKATVDTWMRISDIDPAKLIPALLSYVSSYRGEADNQAIRYLKYAIKTLNVDDPAVHNALISIYASSKNYDEEPLMQFLQTHSSRPKFDFDFALRVCTQFDRTQCSVYIYSSMGLYEEAVKLALKKDSIELASSVADKPSNDPQLRKMLWLQVARKVISKGGFDKAVELMNRCELLKIEDLLPLVPEFTVLDKQLKNQVINSMENYNEQISELNREMEDSVHTASNVKQQINKFEKRYALIEPGEGCAICEFPLATRRFYVFPCQHAFHYDCLLDSIKKTADYGIKQKIAEAQKSSTSNNIKELPSLVDEILSEKCILCGEGKIDSIDVPLVTRQMETFAF